MEKTLLILKPSAISRRLMGEVISRVERKGLFIAGLKMMQLDDAILSEHYGHLSAHPFFGDIKGSMMLTPVVVICVEGIDAVATMRALAGATKGRNAVPGTIRGDLSMSVQHNIVHTSDSVESAEIELNRFFLPNEIFDYKTNDAIRFLYAPDEL